MHLNKKLRVHSEIDSVCLSVCTTVFKQMSVCTTVFKQMSVCTTVFKQMFVCTTVFKKMSVCTTVFKQMSFCTTLFKLRFYTNFCFILSRTTNAPSYLVTVACSIGTGGAIWWLLPMTQSVRYSTILFLNFISCLKARSSLRLIIADTSWHSLVLMPRACTVVSRCRTYLRWKDRLFTNLYRSIFMPGWHSELECWLSGVLTNAL